MAIFEEKKPCAGRTICFILVVFALSYSFWDLGMRELFRNESEYAVAAQEMNSFPPLITLHGQMQTGIFPLFPALAKGLSACGLPMEFSLRFISVVSLLALVMIVWLACYRTGGIQASAAGAAVMLSTLLAAEKAVEGYPHMLTALILYSGWLLWFELALGRGNWNLAWIAAGLFGGLAYCNAGVTGLIYFAIPLLIQQRPLNVWTKLRYPGVPVCLGILALFILLQWLPQWEAKMAMAAPVQQEGPAFSGYFKQLIGFLPDIFFRFLPWSLMLWAPFCSALIPLDPNPLFGKFHRILFLTLGVMLWLNPETRSRDLLYLTPLLAVLIGEFYWIVVRRYGFRFFFFRGRLPAHAGFIGRLHGSQLLFGLPGIRRNGGLFYAPGHDSPGPGADRIRPRCNGSRGRNGRRSPDGRRGRSGGNGRGGNDRTRRGRRRRPLGVAAFFPNAFFILQTKLFSEQRIHQRSGQAVQMGDQQEERAGGKIREDFVALQRRACDPKAHE